jgi:hypothetical protein
MDMKKKSTKELRALALELHDSIYGSECFGSRDVVMYSLALRILEQRGVDVQEGRTLRLS